MLEIVIYRDTNGKEPFVDWLESLPVKTQDRVQVRVLRLRLGNPGDCKSVGDGVFELRMFFEGGIRVYFGRDGNRIVVLLCGGDKNTQRHDIEKAKRYWEAYKNG